MSVDEALIYHRITALAERHFHPELDVAPDTTLQSLYTEPQGMTEFLMDFFTEFDVDHSAFHFSKFFRSDYYQYAVYFDILRRVEFPITFAHLAEVAAQKKWFDPQLA